MKTTVLTKITKQFLATILYYYFHFHYGVGLQFT